MTETGGGPQTMPIDVGRFATLLPDPVVVVDTDGTVQWANEAAERTLGRPLVDWVGTSGLDLIHPDDLALAILSIDSVQDKVVGTPIELRIRTTEGWRLVELVGGPTTDDRIILVLRDLTERRRWEVANDGTSRFRSLVHYAASVTLLVAPDGTVESSSGALTRQLGVDQEDVHGQPLANLVSPSDHEALAAAMTRAPGATSTEPASVEVGMMRADGSIVPFELTIVDLTDDPTVEGYVVSGHDITRLRDAQDRLAHMAAHDPLTGLANRSELARHLSDALSGAAAGDHVVAFIDVDRFKPVNDLLGHDVGDELLVTLGERLRALVRENDLVARLGGDEFVVVARADEAGAEALKRRLEQAVAAPFDLSAGQVVVDASVGMVRAADDHTTEGLLAEADTAMYSVKRARRGGPMEPSMTVRERRSLAEDMLGGLETGQFELHYQPIVDLNAVAVSAHEALIRWRHPVHGLLPPAHFLTVAEDSGRDDAMSRWVVARAIADLATRPEDQWVSVNCSARQIGQPSFISDVAGMVADAGVAPSRLCIEVTERAVFDNPEATSSSLVLDGLAALSDLGLKIAIDDFGTGYSSLTHVIQFPVDVLKIDMSFVQGLGTDSGRESVVAAILGMARGLGLTAIAEGVETPRAAEMLRRLGCPLGQGYLFGRPDPTFRDAPLTA